MFSDTEDIGSKIVVYFYINNSLLLHNASTEHSRKVVIDREEGSFLVVRRKLIYGYTKDRLVQAWR